MTELDTRNLRRLVAEADHPLGVKELLRLSGLHPGQQTELKRTLREMVRTGELHKDGKRYVVPAPPPSKRPPAEHPAPRRAPARPEQAPRERATAAPRGADALPGKRKTRVGRAEERAQELDAQDARSRFNPFDTGYKPQPSQGEAGGRFKRSNPFAPAAGQREVRGRFEEPAVRARVERQPGKGVREEPQRSGARRGEARGARFEDREAGGPRGRRPGPGAEEVVGTLRMHRDGFGFVHPPGKDQVNVFLPPHEASRALDGDKVRVEAWGPRDRKEGRLIEVLDRQRQLVVGLYEERGRRDAVVVPRDATLPEPVRVPRTQMARPGDLVKVRLGVGAGLLEAGEGLFGEVAGSLGKPGDPSAEVLSIAYNQGFNDEFPPEVMDEADAYATTVSEDEARGEGRRDLRQMALVTIDGIDARDFDDAVYAEDHPQGWRLVVAIADVTHYVRRGTALDGEALRRATSVYLPDRVLPMLPERLSNGICSLRPDEDRLCMVADMVVDRRGRLQESQVYPGVMRSHARCTYEEVQDVLDGKDVPHRNAFKPHFQRLWALATTLNKMRVERGAIDFDLPEHKIIIEDGRPVRMEKRERKDSHRLIEECMLAANEAVAKFFIDEGLPSVYRFHGEPDEDKLAAFGELAGAHGFFLEPGNITSKDLNRLIKQLEGHPEQRALNQLLLRSMMQAVYSATNVGHYGLAAEHYLHFTSPIRRYPDLLVHRLLKGHWARQGQPRDERALEREEEQLEEMALQSSDRERAAMLAEREVTNFYACLMMKDRVGEEFACTVTGVADFGFFCELDEVHVEALVKSDTLGPGAKLDKALHQLVWPGGRRVRVGQKLTGQLSAVNVERRQMDLEVVQFEGEEERLEAARPRVRKAVRHAEAESATGPVRRRRAAAPEELERARTTRRRPEPVDLSAVPPSKRVMRKRTGGDHPVLPPPREEADRLPGWMSRPPPDDEVVEALEAEVPARSPHPGFDRLRALAAQGKGRAGAQGSRPERTPARAHDEAPLSRHAKAKAAAKKSKSAARFGKPKKGGGKGGPKKRR